MNKNANLRILSWTFLVLFALSGCRESILHGLNEREANKAYLTLARAGIATDKVQEGTEWRIEVASNDVLRALGLLDQGRHGHAHVSDATAGKSGLLPGREELNIGIERKISAALEETLLAIPGVLDARVHLNMSYKRSTDWNSRFSTTSASVILVVGELWNKHEDMIRNIIASGVGIPANQVTLGILAAPDQMQYPAEPHQTDGETLRRLFASSNYLPFIIGLALCILALLPRLLAKKKVAPGPERTAILKPQPAVDREERPAHDDLDTLSSRIQ